MVKPLHVYEIHDGETHWYVATSATSALREYLTDHSYGSIADYRREVLRDERATITELSDSKRLDIRFENEQGDYDEEVTKTCRAWAKECGKGVLCTTLI